jgi:hypothetical protein
MLHLGSEPKRQAVRFPSLRSGQALAALGMTQGINENRHLTSVAVHVSNLTPRASSLKWSRGGRGNCRWAW